MTDILNLDELKITRTVTLKGKARTLRSMTVEQFIDAKDFNAKLEAADGMQQVSLLVDHILEFMDDTTRGELLKLELAQLRMLLAFVRGSDAKTAQAAGGND